jgi:hypothetical protein
MTLFCKGICLILQRFLKLFRKSMKKYVNELGAFSRAQDAWCEK